jgi:NAD(P)-dependent dehydrogenase (short-subunit alcohol dehydrogenase family)
VCADPEVAAVLVGLGACVVLCGTDAAAVAQAVVALREAGGRVAALIGDLADPEGEAAAVAMAAELFGGGGGGEGARGEPVVVRSVSEARQQQTKPAGSNGV